MFVITEKALMQGFDYPKIVSSNTSMYSGTDQSVIIRHLSRVWVCVYFPIEPVFAAGEFIVAAGRTEGQEDIREVDLEMEMARSRCISGAQDGLGQIYYLVDSSARTSGTRLNLFNDSCWFRGAGKPGAGRPG